MDESAVFINVKPDILQIFCNLQGPSNVIIINDHTSLCLLCAGLRSGYMAICHHDLETDNAIRRAQFCNF